MIPSDAMIMSLRPEFGSLLCTLCFRGFLDGYFSMNMSLLDMLTLDATNLYPSCCCIDMATLLASDDTSRATMRTVAIRYQQLGRGPQELVKGTRSIG